MKLATILTTASFFAIFTVIPVHASAATTLPEATQVTVDKTCTGVLADRIHRGIGLATKYGKLQGTKPLNVVCVPEGQMGGAAGTYDTAKEIRINKAYGKDATATVVHELGHYLDFQRFGYNGNYVTPTNQARRTEVRKAIVQTKAWKTWAECQQAADDTYMADYCGYLLDRTEMFARAYVNFITAQSGDYFMKRYMNSAQWEYVQWNGSASQNDKNDFAPILVAMDKLV